MLRCWKVPEAELPGWPPVTLRGLLSHTAGLTVHGFNGYAQGAALPTVVQILNGQAPANNDPVSRFLEPGTAFRCSGGGTTVARTCYRKVLDKVAGASTLSPVECANFRKDASVFLARNPVGAVR